MCGEPESLWGCGACTMGVGTAGAKASGAHKQKATRGGKFIPWGKLRLCRVAKADEVQGAQAALRPGGEACWRWRS